MQQGSSVGVYTNVWTDSRYEQVRHFKHWVFIAVDRIATDIAMHSPNLSRLFSPASPRSFAERAGSTSPSSRRCLPLSLRQKALTPLLSHEQMEPVEETHPLAALLRDPNEPDTAYDLWYETVLFLLLTGSAYWWLPPGPLGLPAAIWVMPSHWVWAHLGRDRVIDSYEIRPVEGNYLRMSIPAHEMIHFRRKSPISKVDGYSPLTAGQQWIDTQESVDRTRWFSFRNGLFPGVALEFADNVKVPQPETLDRIEAKILNRYGSEVNANKPLFIPPGMKVKKLNVSPSELDFCASADQLRDHILALFGIPAAVAHVARDSSYGALIAAWAGYYMSTVNPLYRFLGQVVTEKLCRRYDPALRAWWEDRTPQDPELQEKVLATDLSYGARTMNEVRQLRGQEPYPQDWANVPWIPLNTLPVDVALDLAKSNGRAFLDGNAPGSPGGNRGTLHDARGGGTDNEPSSPPA